MSKTIVIFLLGSEFNDRHAERIGYDEYCAAKIDFIVWECLFQRPAKTQKYKLPLLNKFSVVRQTNIFLVIKSLRKLKGYEVIFIDSLGTDFSSRLTRWLIRLSGHKIGLLRIQHLIETKTNFFKNALQKIRSFDGLKVRIINALSRAFIPNIRYDFLIFAGKEGFSSEISNQIETCSYDVVTFNKSVAYSVSKTSEKGLDRGYIVFLDNGSYEHPDADECHLYIKGNLSDFVRKLNKYFRQIERRFDIEIIIAAHPKLTEEHYKKFFPEFRVVFGDTASLVKGSSACLLVYSNSINFPILSRKPIFILTDYNHINSYLGAHQQAASDILGCPIYNLDHDIVIDSLPTVCTKNYEDFISSYVASPECCANRSVWEPFIKKVREGGVAP